MSSSADYPRTPSEFQQWDQEATDQDIRSRAHRARSEDEYLDIIREAGSLGAGLRIMGDGRRASSAPAKPIVIPPFDPSAIPTEYLEDYEIHAPHDPEVRARYLRNPIVAAVLAELESRRQQKEKIA